MHKPCPPACRTRAILWPMIAVLVLDQLSKYLLLYGVGMVDGIRIEVTSFFRLVMVWNKGVSFGMLSKAHDVMPYVLIAVALAITVVLFRLAQRSARRGEQIAYGAVMGGAIGNAIDRVVHGAVADFFYFHLGNLGWPAFNVADSAICLGVMTLLYFAFKHPARP